MEKIVKTQDYLALKVENATIYNPEWLINPFGVRDNGSPIHFGTFSLFGNSGDEAIENLKQAVKSLEQEGAVDTVFEGKYPKIFKDDYGWKIKVSNKTNFFENLESKEPMTDTTDVLSQIWDLEIHLFITKRNEIYLTVPRAIKKREKQTKQNYEDSLFSDNETLDDNDIFL